MTKPTSLDHMQSVICRSHDYNIIFSLYTAYIFVIILQLIIIKKKKQKKFN